MFVWVPDSTLWYTSRSTILREIKQKYELSTRVTLTIIQITNLEINNQPNYEQKMVVV